MNQNNKNYIRLFIAKNKILYLSLFLLTLTFFICFSFFRVPFLVFIYPTIIFYLFFLGYSTYSFLKFKKINSTLNQILKSDFDKHLALLNINDLNYIDVKQLKRTLELQENEINSLRNELKFQNKQIEEDVSTWIHQIKIPITAMKLDLEDVDSEVSRQLKSELFRIELYIEMILNYFRLESTTTDYLFTSIDIDKVVKNEIKRFSTEFIKRNISLDLNSKSTISITDEKWFAFIIDQLLSNALKYTPNKGKITIKIDKNQVEINDTGIGISSNDLPRIFERGYTGYNGRIDKKASGLGLYLIKKVCNDLNILIDIKSELGIGTKVILTLIDSQFNQI